MNLKKKTAQFSFTLWQFLFFLQNRTHHKLTPNLVDHKSSDYVLEIAYACERSNNIIYYYIVCASIFPPVVTYYARFPWFINCSIGFFFDQIAKIFKRHNSLSVLIYGQRFFSLQRLGVRKGKKNSACRLYYIPTAL